MSDATHYVGDDCPGGHVEAATQLLAAMELPAPTPSVQGGETRLGELERLSKELLAEGLRFDSHLAVLAVDALPSLLRIARAAQERHDTAKCFCARGVATCSTPGCGCQSVDPVCAALAEMEGGE